jgi:hypothetical protein
VKGISRRESSSNIEKEGEEKELLAWVRWMLLAKV